MSMLEVSSDNTVFHLADYLSCGAFNGHFVSIKSSLHLSTQQH